MAKFSALVALSILTLLVPGCGDDENPLNPDTIQFSRHVQPVLNEYESILKSAGVFPEGLQMDSWSNLIKGWQRGEVVIPFDADNSLLVELTTKLDNTEELSPDKLNLLIRWITEGAPNDEGEIPYANSTNLLYVCNQDEASISIIDTDAKLVIRTVDLTKLGLGLPINSNPHHVAVEPDGSSWYVSLLGQDKVLKFNRENEFVAEASISIPALLAAHPDNGLLYVSRFPQAAGGDEPLIGVIERATMQVQDDIVVQPTPHAIAVDGSGEFVYTCSISSNLVVPINAAAGEAEAQFVNLGPARGPIQLAVSPDDQVLAVSAQISNEMFIIDVSDPGNRTISKSIPVNATPWHPVFSPDGGTVYVGNQGANTISAVAVASGNVTVMGNGSGDDGIAQPHGIAITGDGSFVFVSNRNVLGAYTPRFDLGDNRNAGTVVVVNTSTNTVDKIIEIENFGSGMAISQL